MIEQELKLPDVDVIVRGGKVYAVTETELPASGLLSEIKEFYHKAYSDVKKIIVDEQFDLYVQERVKQLKHIEDMVQKSRAIIPASLHGAPVMYYKNSICEVRWVQYKPNVITSDAYRLVRLTQSPDGAEPGYTKIWNFCKDLAADARVVINIEQNVISQWHIFCYSENLKRLFTPGFVTYHTMSDNNLCTGDFEAEDFWKHANFNNLMNAINLFSLGRDNVMNNMGREINYRELLHDRFVTNIATEVLWRT